MKSIQDIIRSAQEPISSSWTKIGQITGQMDFLAVIEPGEQETSIVVLTRESGLKFLTDRGCDITHPSMAMLAEPATGLTKESRAIWVVVLADGQAHIAKIVQQLMAQGGSA